MPNTSIKVPIELRDRLSALARRRHVTLAAAITHALDIAERAEFWEQVRTSMPERPPDTTEADDLGRTLTDGLDPDEDWSDVL
jgi:DNA-binding transcriptional regulator/RsmH inhibitor MraZ